MVPPTELWYDDSAPELPSVLLTVVVASVVASVAASGVASGVASVMGSACCWVRSGAAAPSCAKFMPAIAERSWRRHACAFG